MHILVKLCAAMLMVPSLLFAQSMKTLQQGLTYHAWQPPDQSSEKAVIHLLRIDPAQWQIQAMVLSQTGQGEGKTAKQWAKEKKLVAVINAGMFHSDHRTHVGYMRLGNKINNGKYNHYESLAMFGNNRFLMLDKDKHTKVKEQSSAFPYVVQNLRLIKNPGINRWSQQGKKWSEAALAIDKTGHMVFVFSRFPRSMHQFNRMLLKHPWKIQAAQHLEGGPEAQMYIKLGQFEIDLFGSYETGFNENDNNNHAWQIPNIISVTTK